MEKNQSTENSCAAIPILDLVYRKSFMVSFPKTFVEPLSLKTKPVRIFIVVVFPAPLGPSKPKNSPFLIGTFA